MPKFKITGDRLKLIKTIPAQKENENIINQGLFYLFLILDHPSEFEKIVREKGIKNDIQLLEPRLICIALGYNKYDAFAVKLINDLVGIPII